MKSSIRDTLRGELSSRLLGVASKVSAQLLGVTDGLRRASGSGDVEVLECSGRGLCAGSGDGGVQ